MIVAEHMTRLIATLHRRSLERVQARATLGDERAKAKLASLGVSESDALIVRHEPHRRYKWALVAVS